MRGRGSRKRLPIRSHPGTTGDPPRFRLLGAVQACGDGGELELGGPLQRALLAILVLNVGRVVSRDQLIDGLWETEPPPRAARSLETNVSRLEARVDADLALGEGASLVGELQKLRSQYPARERFTEQLMLALYRSGRQTDALEAYRGTYRHLHDDLGLEPDPRLRELERAILRHDEALGPLPLRARARLGGDSRLRLSSVAAVGCVLALTGVFVASSGGTHQRRRSPKPGLILVDAASGAVRADVPVGDSLGAARFGYAHLRTLGENGVMAEVDPVNGALVRFVPVGVLWGEWHLAPAESG